MPLVGHHGGVVLPLNTLSIPLSWLFRRAWYQYECLGRIGIAHVCDGYYVLFFVSFSARITKKKHLRSRLRLYLTKQKSFLFYYNVITTIPKVLVPVLDSLFFEIINISQ